MDTVVPYYRFTDDNTEVAYPEGTAVSLAVLPSNNELHGKKTSETAHVFETTISSALI